MVGVKPVAQVPYGAYGKDYFRVRHKSGYVFEALYASFRRQEKTLETCGGRFMAVRHYFFPVFQTIAERSAETYEQYPALTQEIASLFKAAVDFFQARCLVDSGVVAVEIVTVPHLVLVKQVALIVWPVLQQKFHRCQDRKRIIQSPERIEGFERMESETGIHVLAETRTQKQDAVFVADAEISVFCFYFGPEIHGI